jgi:glycosyltransferase involved in cell wall biosynthesis
MSAARRYAFIGNALPRRCGIATFTTDLQGAVEATGSDVETCIVAMTDNGQSYNYAPEVRLSVDDQDEAAYVHAAQVLNEGRFDCVCLQHEFGIFGGEAGEHVLSLLAPLRMPVVTTLHTVLSQPSPAQRRVLDGVIAASSRVVVMAEKARRLLESVYAVAPGKIDVIPHGIPDHPLVGPEAPKQRLGFAGRMVILTFGLLSPNKGIEVMIDAMPGILARRPDSVYVVLGATHPNLVRDQGEAYRESLVARARQCGVGESVVFLDRFVDRDTLLAFIAMCDVYVTPYANAAQMTSGTLAYSFGLGRAVVSTPYWHAEELLADGRGILVPFADPQALADSVAGLLTDDVRRDAMGRHAYAASRSMTWDRTAARYVAAFERARREHRMRVLSPEPRDAGRRDRAPEMRTDHLLAMCDDTGILQHAVHSVPDRSHGYCVDDNARALLLSCALGAAGEVPLPDSLTARFASFIQHAWNPATGRFRNFMGFDRRWLEEAGSQDSHGRSLWALGTCARDDASPSRRRWAAALFQEALPKVAGFTSPRAWAFALLGLDGFCAAEPNHVDAARLRDDLASRLMHVLHSVATPDWRWFESGLAYDNARLPQALIVTGVATGRPDRTAAGIESLRWLTRLETAPAGHFRPVGSDSFGDHRAAPAPFDQQPLEAAAAISASLAAARVDGSAEWDAAATRAFAWFLGRNDLGVPLVDVETGSCRDGLHADRANENRGAESVLSYLMGLAEVRQAARLRDAGAAMLPRRTVRV